MKNDLKLAALCAAVVSLGIGGCDSGNGDGSSGGTEVGTADAGDDGATSTPMDGTAGTGGTGAADGSSDDGPVDPTEGEVPPTFDCAGANGVYPTDVIIEPEEAQGANTPIEALDGVSVIDGDLLINSVNYFSLDFLQCITEVRGDIQIFGNPFLVDMSGTDNITAIGRLPQPLLTDPTKNDIGKGTITISSNPALTEINGFASITQIGQQDPTTMELSPQSLVIRQNPAATTITGFNSLVLIFESLVIQENDALLDIDGLQGLQGVGGAFTVSRNPNLCISSVNAVGGGLLTYDPEHSTTTQNNDGC
jgi:hypothetical protein